MKSRRTPMGMESRTLLLFVICALVPVAAFALLGYFVVSGELQRIARTQLAAASKSYGLAVYERVQQIDLHATVLLQRHLRGEIDQQTVASFSDQRARIRVVNAAARVPASDGGALRVRRKLLLPDENNGSVAIELVATESGRSAALRAELSPDFLWNSEAALTTESSACVGAGKLQLHCTSAPWAAPSATGNERVLQAQWSLYLAAVYGNDPWTITISQPESVAYASLATFRWMLPASAVLAVVLALLVGSIFIRRSHAPLRVLTRAARQIERHRFSEPIRVTSRDEYGRLGHAFNRMAGSLKNQFDLLSAYVSLDHAILSRLGTEAAASDLLPKLPDILGRTCVGVALLTPGGRGRMLMVTCSQPTVTRIPLERARIDKECLELTALRRISERERTECALLDEFWRARATAVLVTPIVVERELRGFVIASDDSDEDGAHGHELSGIAHRLAVSIGNEDREVALVRQAFHDSLTGLANREQLHQDMAAALGRVRDQSSGGGAILFIDLDRFKAINDSFGHSTGDQLLCLIAQRLARAVPPEATLARLGGDEFMVLAPDLERTRAAALASAIQQSLHEPCELHGVTYVAQASIGIATYPLDGLDVDTLLRCADIALYRAKSSGRGRVTFFDAAMAADASERLAFESQLRIAIARALPFVSYQPKVDAEGRFIGVEALARWLGEDGVPIAPAAFIPIAEETGLIVPLGELILRQVCRQMRCWLDEGVEIQHVAVNISMVQMRDPRFPLFVLSCLAEHGVPARMLELELTESLFADDPHSVAELLQDLTQAGVRIAIDDFGTGFSSMSLLRHYPISTLKIDRAFVLECHGSASSRALVSALIDVGHALSLQVVAEGVENEAQRAVLAQLGCDAMQGFLFSKSLTPREVAEFARGQRACEEHRQAC